LHVFSEQTGEASLMSSVWMKAFAWVSRSVSRASSAVSPVMPMP
jgi:hypothetical protein